MAFTSQSLAKAREYADRMKEKMARFKEGAEEAIGNGIQVTEVGGTSFAIGYAHGRWGEEDENGQREIKVLGIPLDLGVGFALTGIGMFGGLGKYGEHGINIGSGALAAYGYRSGYELGCSAADDSDSKASSKAMPRRTSGQPHARMNGASVSTGWEPQGQVYAVRER